MASSPIAVADASKTEASEAAILPSFLTGLPPGPINAVLIPFASSEIPEYEGLTALTIDNVLSPEECAQLIALAESKDRRAKDYELGWELTPLGVITGVQVSATRYRESGRAIWFSQTIVDRIWERCAMAVGLREMFAVVPQQDGKVRQGEWQFRRVNEYMRFLRYTPGQFFKPHFDEPYYCETEMAKFQTHYTLQLYLSGPASNSSTGEGVVGGATAFLSRDKSRRFDVVPKVGRVLIFQHDGLLHEGADVKQGVKYTMRTELEYEWVEDSASRR